MRTGTWARQYVIFKLLWDLDTESRGCDGKSVLRQKECDILVLPISPMRFEGR
jgi:hypothetical protein